MAQQLLQHAYLPKQRQHTGLRAGTHGLIDQLAVFEHQQGGDAHNIPSPMHLQKAEVNYYLMFL